MASVNSQPKTRVEQDIENWKKQQMLMGHKGGANLPGGSGSLNSLLYGNSSGSGANYSSNAGGTGFIGRDQGSNPGGISGYDANNANLRKKRRRKRSKSNR